MFGILLFRRTSIAWNVPTRSTLISIFLQRRNYHGNVKSFNNKKGFGFIHPELELQNEIIDRYGNWKDVFVHYTDIEDEVRLLIPTTKVEFDCVFEESGPVARSVRKIIPKKKKMVIERWLNAPEGLDDLVKQKALIPPNRWAAYLHSFYTQIALKNKEIYSSTRLESPGEQKNHVEYIDMANDLLSSLAQPEVYDNNEKSE